MRKSTQKYACLGMLTSLVLLSLECFFVCLFSLKAYKTKRSKYILFLCEELQGSLGRKAETKSVVNFGSLLFLFVCLLGRCAKEINHALYFLVLAGNGNRIV